MLAVGSSKALYIYYEGAFYDITPLDTAITGATFTSTNNSANVTINKTSHTLQAGDYITLSSVTVPGATSTLNGAITAISHNNNFSRCIKFFYIRFCKN